MKKLIIEVIYSDNTKRVEIPFEIPSRVTLPNEYPFNQNIYLGPDNGFSMQHLYITKDGKIDYCDQIIELHEGVNRFSPFKYDRYVFNFEVREE